MKFLTSTLLFAATAICALGADAPVGSEENPLKGEVRGLNPNNAGVGNTIYVDGMTGGYWMGGGHNSYNFSANIVIGEGGMTIDNGASDCRYTFSGSVSGTGDFTYNGSTRRPVVQHYTFIGDFSGYSGDIDFSGARNLDNNHTYFHFGNGEHAAPSDTNVAGTGSISVNGILSFNYSGYADAGTTAITIGNPLLSAPVLEFLGLVNYVVPAELKGYAGGTLTISNEGKTSLSGEVSGFGSVTVAKNSTLEISGHTSLPAPIENSGKVALKNSAVFALDNLPINPDGAYIVISGNGGSIDGGNTMASKNFSLGGTPLSENRNTTITVDDGTLTVAVEPTDLIWSGTNDNNTWAVGISNWTGEAFYDNDKATFDETAEARTVSIAEDVTACSTNIREDYTFEFLGDAIVTSASLTFSEDGQSVLTLTGDGTFCFGNENNSPALSEQGRIEISNGAILKFFPNTQGEYNDTDVTIRVCAGGTLDVAGSGDTTFNLILDGGTLTSSVDNKELWGWKQLPRIILTEDSIVDAVSDFGMVGSGFGKTTLFLCGHTLEKAGTEAFSLTNTKISEGTIRVTAGTLTLRGVSAEDAKINVGTIAALCVHRAGNNSGTSVVGELNSDGEIVIEGGSVLELVNDSEISGALTINVRNAVGSLRVSKGANLTLKVSSVSSTGTITVLGKLTLGVDALTIEYGKVAFETGSKLVISDRFLENNVGVGTVAVVSASEIKFGDTKLEGSKSPKNLDKLVAGFISYSKVYKVKWSYADGVLYAEITK